MTLAEKIIRAKNDYDEVYKKGVADGSIQKGTEVEITSDITNALQLRNTLFNNVDTTHAYCAILTKATNGEFVNNQVISIFIVPVPNGDHALRFRDEKYSNIRLTPDYDASVTIGDIYKVFDLGEVQYGN